MPEVMSEEYPKARKQHVCELCRNKIQPGERYVLQHLSGDNGPYTFKSHEHCSRISHAIWDYADPDYGMTDSDFMDAVNSLMSEFVCPFRCGEYDRDRGCCNDGHPTDDRCLRLFDEYMKTHKLELVRGKFGFEWKMTEVKKDGGKNR